MTLRFEAPLGRGHPVLLLHGFFSDHRAFDRLWPQLLAHGLQVHRVDLPGHGRNASFDGGWPELLEALEGWAERQPEAPSVLGYSMGARVLRQWLLRPGRALRRAVLVAPHPGWSEPEAAMRREQDEALARSLLDSTMDASVSRWASLPVFAGQDTLPRALLQRQNALRLAQTPSGLAASLRRFGSGTCAAGGLPQRGAGLALLHGDRIEADRCRAQQLAEHWPMAFRRQVAGAGHNLLLETPHELLNGLLSPHLGDWAASG